MQLAPLKTAKPLRLEVQRARGSRCAKGGRAEQAPRPPRPGLRVPRLHPRSARFLSPRPRTPPARTPLCSESWSRAARMPTSLPLPALRTLRGMTGHGSDQGESRGSWDVLHSDSEYRGASTPLHHARAHSEPLPTLHGSVIKAASAEKVRIPQNLRITARNQGCGFSAATQIRETR